MSSGLNGPFFTYTYFNANQVASVVNVNYSTDGSGTGEVVSLASKYSGYSRYGLNNAGQDSRYLVGVRPDGSEVDLGIVSTPSTVTGIFRNNITALDTPSSFTLQSIDGDRVIFSNVPITPGPIAFTAPAGDYAATALCFLSGTRILTARGEVAVEDLEIGDIAITATGARRPITWIGQRETVCSADAAPVQVRAGAFGHGLPARDLFLSPGHPVLVGADADNEGGVLVPVMCLINGTTVSRTSLEAVTYWHVELESHDILLAEGLPVESYLDLGSRSWFEGLDSALFDPDFVSPQMKGRCRPVATEGAVVEAERARLDGVFAAGLAAQCAWSFDGIVSEA